MHYRSGEADEPPTALSNDGVVLLGLLAGFAVIGRPLLFHWRQRTYDPADHQ